MSDSFTFLIFSPQKREEIKCLCSPCHKNLVIWYIFIYVYILFLLTMYIEYIYTQNCVVIAYVIYLIQTNIEYVQICYIINIFMYYKVCLVLYSGLCYTKYDKVSNKLLVDTYFFYLCWTLFPIKNKELLVCCLFSFCSIIINFTLQSSQT